ncbi:MAG TPA: hypothetical protein VMU61_10205 [Candidatus Aquilonibacter sp.]|nr:hypothetical protein [Candidatus Aquilonibacter sp.]
MYALPLGPSYYSHREAAAKPTAEKNTARFLIELQHCPCPHGYPKAPAPI